MIKIKQRQDIFNRSVLVERCYTHGTLDMVGDLATISPGGAIFPVHILQLRSNKCALCSSVVSTTGSSTFSSGFGFFSSSSLIFVAWRKWKHVENSHATLVLV